jgi:hypothetical protein
MPGQAELFRHAAECERLMDLASDPVTKRMLEKMRDLWVALANEHKRMPAGQLIQKIDDLSKMQSDLVRATWLTAERE